MKTLSWLLLVGVIGLYLIIGCERDSTSKKEEKKIEFSGRLDSVSACKNHKSIQSISDSTDSIDCIIYNFTEEINKLYMKHLNKRLNCCPDSLHVIITKSNDTIFIQETDGGGYCGCVCFYDFYIELNGIEAKKYQFHFEQPYLWGQNFNFELDFSHTQSGMYCNN